jgi:uncharacterized delta-60 repeat protein
MNRITVIYDSYSSKRLKNIVISQLNGDGEMSNPDEPLKANTPRALDPTFGNNGTVSFSDTLPDSNIVVCSTQLPSDGFLCSGYLAKTIKPWLIKLLANGKVDTSFGEQGMRSFDVARMDGSKKAMSIMIGVCQTETHILVVGWSQELANEELTLVRFTLEGAIDSAFGVNGVKRLSLDIATQDTSDPDEKTTSRADILFYDHALIIPVPYAVVRLTEDGELDTSFNGTGILPIAERANMAITVQPTDGKLLFAIKSRIFRYTNAGTIDKTFGSEGIYTAPGDAHTISKLIADLNGVITYLGVPDQNDPHHFLGQLIADGTFDPGFNGGKRLLLRLLDGNIYGYDGHFAVDGQNRRCLAMSATQGDSTIGVVLRYLRNGLMDVTLGDAGMFVTPLGDAKGIYVRAQDKLVMFGQSWPAMSGQAVGIV